MQYDFNLAPNTGLSIDVAGKFFKYKSGNGVIRVRTSKGGVVDLLPGQGVWNTDFTGLTVTDKSGLQNAGVILAGDFDFHDDRITGTVDVVDGGKARTEAGGACIAYVYQDPAPGLPASVQLVNPAGSGKKVYIEQMALYCTGTMSAGAVVRRADGLLANAHTWPNGSKKRVDGVASAALLRKANVGSEVGTGPYLCGIDKALRMFRFSEPLLLVQGTGLLITNGAAGEDIGATFEYFEDPA